MKEPRKRHLLAWILFCCALFVTAAGTGLAADARQQSPVGATKRPPARSAEKPDPYARAVELYKAHKIGEAATVLEEAIRTANDGAGYRSLLGWCYLRLGRVADAESEFRQALRTQPDSSEAIDGLAEALSRAGRTQDLLNFSLDRLAKHPDDAKAARLVESALAVAGRPVDRRLEPPPDSPVARPKLEARAGKKYFEVPDGDGFTPIFVKGVNLGVALPGKYPSEFPENEATYRTWLDQIGAMGANVVRVYTLLPPVFYRALAAHDRAVVAAARAGKSSGPLPAGYLFLIQGVWTQLPEGYVYDDEKFVAGFEAEIDRVLDAIHGNIAVGHRPGHAYGLYREDVSSMTLAIILGREWESYSVKAFDAMRPEGAYHGRYFEVDDGTPTERWMAAMMDHAVGYEASHYGVMRPVTFTNWPTLDPLHHPTESSLEEERRIKKRLGIPYDDSPIPAWNVDEDAVSLDASRIHDTAEGRAGHFAAYHAYPYYPDFMNLDPGYAKARDSLGPNNYAGYLRDLVKHHEGIPVLIAELGVPTSRGVAHGQPQGFTHGGHDEVAQGKIDARLVRDTYETGCAGGILFAWLDEWFKRNWQVTAFESPSSRNRKWLNAQDPEQNYGLLGARPGAKGPAIVLDGKGGDWQGTKPLVGAARPASGPALTAIRAASDEAYLYLRLDARGLDADGDGRIDWDRRALLVGIDTHGAEIGDTRFPCAAELHAPTGMEFMVGLDGPGASWIRADKPYDLLTNKMHRPYRSVANDDGDYVDIKAMLQITRYGRDGTIYPETFLDRSPLKRGTTDTGDPNYFSLADWDASARTGIIELRLPWGLLDVTDPSSRRVVEESKPLGTEVGTVETEGFRFYAVLLDPGHGILDTLPARADATHVAADPNDLYLWPGWEEPTYHLRLKRSYYIVKDEYHELPSVIAP